MHGVPDLTMSPYGLFGVAFFVLAYVLVIYEEQIHMLKSVPVLVAAGVLWLLVGVAVQGTEHQEVMLETFNHNYLEYTQILLFLLVAMTYINSMEELKVFESLRSKLVRSGWTLRRIFWVTGVLAFLISPVADNLTTALIMGAVVVAVGKGNPKFVAVACINIVVAANAGGAFSPFGDITTLMVWQAMKVTFLEFFDLFLPSLVVWLIPAIIMSLMAIPKGQQAMDDGEEAVAMKTGAKRVIALFLLTILTAVLGHNFLDLPPVYGMMFGLAYLKIFGYLVKIRSVDDNPFDVMRHIQRLEWDTLLFFFGVIMAVGAIGFMGYLSLISGVAYEAWGGMSRDVSVTIANIAVGVLSAIVDNIPIMAAVLKMSPEMAHGQWLLVTLTAGVGGSLLSVGSAAGVALMGTAREYKIDSKGNKVCVANHYTFFSHLKWTWAIALGYAAGIAVHLWINASLF